MADADLITITCTSCSQEKSLEKFAKHPQGRHGRRSKCNECRKAIRMDWVERNRESVRAQGRLAAAKRRSTKVGQEKHRLSSLKYHHKNKQEVMARRKARWASDPVLRLLAWQRTSLHRLLAQAEGRHQRAAEAMMGYSAEELRRHIERQFTKGMSWARMGAEIHIDHIIPVKHFLSRGITDPKIIHALTNLKPMWAEQNRQKAAKVEFLI